MVNDPIEKNDENHLEIIHEEEEEVKQEEEKVNSFLHSLDQNKIKGENLLQTAIRLKSLDKLQSCDNYSSSDFEKDLYFINDEGEITAVYFLKFGYLELFEKYFCNTLSDSCKLIIKISSYINPINKKTILIYLVTESTGWNFGHSKNYCLHIFPEPYLYQYDRDGKTAMDYEKESYTLDKSITNYLTDLSELRFIRPSSFPNVYTLFPSSHPHLHQQYLPVFNYYHYHEDRQQFFDLFESYQYEKAYQYLQFLYLNRHSKVGTNKRLDYLYEECLLEFFENRNLLLPKILQNALQFHYKDEIIPIEYLTYEERQLFKEESLINRFICFYRPENDPNNSQQQEGQSIPVFQIELPKYKTFFSFFLKHHLFSLCLVLIDKNAIWITENNVENYSACIDYCDTLLKTIEVLEKHLQRNNQKKEEKHLKKKKAGQQSPKKVQDNQKNHPFDEQPLPEPLPVDQRVPEEQVIEGGITTEPPPRFFITSPSSALSFSHRTQSSMVSTSTKPTYSFYYDTALPPTPCRLKNPHTPEEYQLPTEDLLGNKESIQRCQSFLKSKIHAFYIRRFLRIENKPVPY